MLFLKDITEIGIGSILPAHFLCGLRQYFQVLRVAEGPEEKDQRF